MGDRSAIYIIQKSGQFIEIYSHWDGEDIVKKLPTALSIAKGRWDDLDYFNRILIQNILDSIVSKDTNTGAGIGIRDIETDFNDRHLDNPAIVVDPKDCIVYQLGQKENKVYYFDEIVNTPETFLKEIWT